MAEEQTKKIEREYIIPLRREWLKVPGYRRAGRAAKTIKKFIAKHMKIPERDSEKVKLDIYLNNEIWFRGKANPPSSIKVKAVKEEGIVRVSLSETPEQVKFIKLKHAKFHIESKKEEKKEAEKETKEESKEIAEEKKEEKEKAKSGEEKTLKDAKKEKLAEKHITKVKETEIRRTALNRH